jgi:predicted nucleic acid-binding protein
MTPGPAVRYRPSLLDRVAPSSYLSRRIGKKATLTPLPGGALDALICAAARHLELALLTRDGDIRQSGLARVIW